MDYTQTYETILSKVDKAIEENNQHPVLLVGDYRHGYLTHLDNGALFDEFLEGNYWNELDVNYNAGYSEQFEQFVKEVSEGSTFGDYQEFALLSNRLKAFKSDLEQDWIGKQSPAKLWDSNDVHNVCRVRINGSRVGLNDEVCKYNDAFKDLMDYLEELDHLAWEHE